MPSTGCLEQLSEQWLLVMKIFGFFFWDSLKSRHAQEYESVLLKMLLLDQITEINLCQRTNSEDWQCILLDRREKCIFSHVNWSWIKNSVSWKSLTFTLRLKMSEKVIVGFVKSAIKNVIEIHNLIQNNIFWQKLLGQNFSE